MSRTYAEKIAAYVLNEKYENIPRAVLDYGKMLLTDTFGVAMANLELDHAKAVREVVTEAGSRPQCTLWGSDQKVQLADAVLHNASLIHGSDYDDTHVGGIVHPSASVVSTALSVGEMTGASGEEIYTAIVLGWEVIVRLALAARGRFHDVGFHGTGIVAPFAAACVAGRLMEVTEGVLVNALGICGSQAAALQEFLRDGSWVKKLHPGWGAHSAIYAVRLAKAGFMGPPTVFEGEFGLYKTHCGMTEGLTELDNLGRVWHTPEITFKMYPVCHMTHSFADCIFTMRKAHGIKPEEVESMECRIENRCFHIVCEPEEAKKNPQTDYMMRFSLPYVAAVSLVKGRVSPWEIDMQLASDSQIKDLMNRITCISDESKSNPGYFPGWVKVVMKDGREYVEDRRYELGTIQNPVDPEAAYVKFRNNLEHYYTKQEIEAIAEQIQNLEHLKTISPLLQSLEFKGQKDMR